MFRLLVTFSLSMFTASCSGSSQATQVPAAQTNCFAGEAEITVGDGYFQSNCGCAEGNNVAIPPASLSCTVAVGTQVVFLFPVEHTEHQIVSSGTPTFSGTPISNPSESSPIRIFPVPFTQAGTYPFVDAFNSSMTGQIIAQ